MNKKIIKHKLKNILNVFYGRKEKPKKHNSELRTFLIQKKENI